VQREHVQSGVEQVKKRIYFLSGFDPRGSSFYYRLFAEELKCYAIRTGRSLKVGRRRGQADALVSSWHVLEEGRTILEVCFLHWDDIVRDHWPRNPLVIARQGLSFAVWYLMLGGLFKISRLCPSVALCGLYPLLFFGFVVVTLTTLAWLVKVAFSAWMAPAMATLLAIGAVTLAIPLCWRLADQQGVIWLFRSILFTHQLGQARDGALRSRMVELAKRVLAHEAGDPASSLLLVGHSSGSFVMAMLAASLRREPGFERVAGRLQLLSLGQNLANLAVHKRAAGFHQDLSTLAQLPRLPWRDITSSDDYLCFAGVDPYRSCGLAIDPPEYPELQIIRLVLRLGLTNWGSLITNQFPLHFQYLQTAKPELQGGFDYFEHVLGEAS